MLVQKNFEQGKLLIDFPDKSNTINLNTNRLLPMKVHLYSLLFTFLAILIALISGFSAGFMPNPRAEIAAVYKEERNRSSNKKCLVCNTNEAMRVEEPVNPDGSVPHLIRNDDGELVPANCVRYVPDHPDMRHPRES